MKNRTLHSLCLCSILGIWPCFIEPRLLSVSKKDCLLSHLPPDLENFTIAHLSDLHFSEMTSKIFLNKITKKLQALRPHLVVFTGDWISYAQLANPGALLAFLQKIQAPYGCFGILGNHDYESYITKDAKGITSSSPPNSILSLWRKCFSSIKAGDKRHPQPLGMHKPLLQILQASPFTLLHNRCVQIAVKNSFLNICGVGDVWASQCDPASAFSHYDKKSVGIVLTHNPESFKQLQNYPGDLLLAGHTHGGQINLPFIRNRLCSSSLPGFLKGHRMFHNKWTYVSRGLGDHKRIRVFSRPELVFLRLKNG